MGAAKGVVQASRVAPFACPDDHTHGTTSNCYGTHGCRCQPCRDGRARQTRELYRRKACGQHVPKVPAIGSQRRIQALIATGWTLVQIGERMGAKRHAMRQLFERNHTSPEFRRRLTAVYDELWDRPPPSDTGREKQSISRARNWARKNGWVPPLALDDDRIDDPTYHPNPADWRRP